MGGKHINFNNLKCRFDLMATRPAPMSPDRMAAEMREKVTSGELSFTSNADMEVVIEIYRSGFIKAIEGMDCLNYRSLKWRDDKVDDLVEFFEFAKLHCKLGHIRQYEVQIEKGNNFSRAGIDKLKKALAGSIFFIRS